MKDNFKIIIGSPIEYEELVAYVWIKEEQIALIQMEEGKDKMKIEFFDEPIKTDVYLDVFIKALEKAKQELLR